MVLVMQGYLLPFCYVLANYFELSIPFPTRTLPKSLGRFVSSFSGLSPMETMPLSWKVLSSICVLRLAGKPTTLTFCNLPRMQLPKPNDWLIPMLTFDPTLMRTKVQAQRIYCISQLDQLHVWGLSGSKKWSTAWFKRYGARKKLN